MRYQDEYIFLWCWLYKKKQEKIAKFQFQFLLKLLIINKNPIKLNLKNIICRHNWLFISLMVIIILLYYCCFIEKRRNLGLVPLSGTKNYNTPTKQPVYNNDYGYFSLYRVYLVLYAQLFIITIYRKYFPIIFFILNANYASKVTFAFFVFGIWLMQVWCWKFEEK
jgi:hypothetical protein